MSTEEWMESIVCTTHKKGRQAEVLKLPGNHSAERHLQRTRPNTQPTTITISEAVRGALPGGIHGCPRHHGSDIRGSAGYAEMPRI